MIRAATRGIRRRGISMFECLAVVSASTIVLLALAGLLRSTFHANDHAQKLLSEQLATEAICRAWRADGHAAVAAEALGTNGMIFTRDDGRRVRYAAEEGKLVRTVELSGRKVESQVLPLPPATTCVLAPPQGASDKLAYLTLRRQPNLAAAADVASTQEFVVALGAAPFMAVTREANP